MLERDVLPKQEQSLNGPVLDASEELGLNNHDVEDIDQDAAALLGGDHETKTTSHQPDNDIISVHVMEGSKGIALYSTVTISICMTICSVLLLYQFEVVQEEQYTNIQSLSSVTTPVAPETFMPLPRYQPHDEVCSHMDSESSSSPLGFAILAFQLPVLQNLTHASLAGAAAMVAALRGDVLHMMFVYNLAFFFLPIGLIYTVLDVRSVLWLGRTGWDQHLLRLPLSLLLTLASGLALIQYTRVFWRIRRILQEQVRRNFQKDPSSSSSSSSSSFPMSLSSSSSSSSSSDYSVANKTDAQLASVIFYMTLFVQLLGWVYYAVTTLEWIAKTSSCSSFATTGIRSSAQQTLADLRVFEMSYSGAAHQSLLLALLFLAATYPSDLASVGSALLTSGWRLLVALASLLHLLRTEMNVPAWSWINTGVEIAVMLPIATASFLLVTRVLRNDSSVTSYQPLNPALVGPAQPNFHDRTPALKDHVPVTRYHCASLFQISRSSRYTQSQRRAARLLGFGTRLLFVEMTVECIILLRQSHMGTDVTHDIYKWGMHVCVLYVFCSIMCVETPFVYEISRKILAVACPAGSLVALWQLSSLLRYTEDIRSSKVTQIMSCLFAVRAASGALQSLGLFLLKNLEPHASHFERKDASTEVECTEIKFRLAKFRWVLACIYMPAVVLYVFSFTLFGNCFAPFISKSLSEFTCTNGSSAVLELAQNFPGMGLFFHFGMLTVMFGSTGAVDGVLTYKPSLNIASLFSIHVCFLILVDFYWDALQTDFWSVGLSSYDLWARVLASFWMIISGCLWFYGERILSVRLIPL